MKKFFTLLVLAACCAAMTWGCSDDKYDDTEIRQEIENLKQEIASMKEQVNSLKTIIDALKEKDSSKRRTKTLFSVTKAAKTCPTKVYRRIIPSRTTELGKSLPVCGTIVHYPHPSNEYRFNRSDRHGS